MAQEFTPAPEEFSPPPETAALPEEFPALGTREEPPRRGRSRIKYLLAAGLMLLTAAWGLALDRPAPTPDTPPDVTLPDGSGGPSEADVAELLDTSWQYENGTVVHFADGVGWWEKDGQLLRFTWEAGADGAVAYTCGYADITYASSSLVLRSVTSSDTARVQGGTLRMGEPFDGLAEALPLSGYTVPDAAAYLTRPTLDLLTGYDWTPTEASGTIYYTELHFAADGTGTFGLGSDGSGTRSTYPFTFEMSDLPYAARVRLLSEGDVVFSTGSGTTLTSQSPQLDCALLFTTDGMQLAVIRLFSDGCTMLSPTAK